MKAHLTALAAFAGGVLDLDAIRLDQGPHNDCSDGMCLYEAYNMLTRNLHTDDCPPDVSPVLHTYGMRLNDALPDDRRQALKRFLPTSDAPSPLAGTRGDGLDEARGYLALDWLIRTYTPAWLDLAGLSAEAQRLRDLRRIVDLGTAQEAGPVVRASQEQASAARDAAEAADRAAAEAAAEAADRAAAEAAAWDAARDAAEAADRAAARDAARAAVWAAAEAADRDAVWAAAEAADRDALQPTVDQLQQSAIDLHTAMIRPDRIGGAA